MALDEVNVARLAVWEPMIQQGATLEQLGEVFGLTRERVRQILVKANREMPIVGRAERRRSALEAYQNAEMVCSSCGETFIRKDVRTHYRKGTHRWKRNLHKRKPEEIARDAAIVADYDAGMVVNQIMEKHDLPAPTYIYRALKWNGRTNNRRATARRRNKEAVAQLKQWVVEEWRRDEMLTSEIADKFSISTAWVDLILDEARAKGTRADTIKRRTRILQSRTGTGTPWKKGIPKEQWTR